ncbi:MAG TPA: alanine--glyoxylate aminotransferase family protein, partial [Bacillota bacterium]|nr:alanine--glyoxylate aminotransferase family protein [Bacillota bacterium]
AAWGDVFQPEQIEQALKENSEAKFVALVHAETSTGALQPLEDIAKIVHAHDALLIADAVTSIAGSPIKIDEVGIDACYSGTQKCLSAPPGLAPVTFSPRALDVMEKKKEKVQSWYLDLSMIRDYWGSERAYHHTAPITMNYALHEALRIVLNEGLENTFKRHEQLGKALHGGLEAMGLDLHVDEQYRLPQLTSVIVPEGINEAEIRTELLQDYSLEIGAGLGELNGKIWRIGLMGHSCQPNNVITVLTLLEQLLLDRGASIQKGAAVDVATKMIKQSSFAK